MLYSLKEKFQSFFQKSENIFVLSSVIFFVALMLLTLIDTSIYYKSLVLIGGVTFLWWFSYEYTAYLIYLLIGWFAFENLLLKFAGTDFALYVKYVPEIILYVSFAFVLIQKAIKKQLYFIKTPINFALGIFVIIGILSTVLNGNPFFTGLLGMRQILRFVIIFYLVIYAHLSQKQLRYIIYLICGIGVFQVGIALLQWMTGGAFNHYLLLDDSFFVGESIEVEGTDDLWSPTQRVFGTFRRYNELAAFLTIIFAFLIASKYHVKKWIDEKEIVFWLLSVGFGAVLILTYARSAWIAVIAMLIFLAIWVKRDKIFTKYFAAVGAILIISLSTYVIWGEVRVSQIRDVHSASLTERVLQTFSLTELKGSYDGFGRLYFFVNTPKVVAQSPFIGVGPGMYGGGVAAALQNKQAYNEAGVAFGIFGETGQIDNNWFSVWGEFGTLGLAFFIVLIWRLYEAAKSMYLNSRDPFLRGLAFALQGMIIAFVILGAFGPYFEIRTFSFYFWLCAGVTISLSAHISEEQYHRITKNIS